MGSFTCPQQRDPRDPANHETLVAQVVGTAFRLLYPRSQTLSIPAPTVQRQEQAPQPFTLREGVRGQSGGRDETGWPR